MGDEKQREQFKLINDVVKRPRGLHITVTSTFDCREANHITAVADKTTRSMCGPLTERATFCEFLNVISDA